MPQCIVGASGGVSLLCSLPPFLPSMHAALSGCKWQIPLPQNIVRGNHKKFQASKPSLFQKTIKTIRKECDSPIVCCSRIDICCLKQG